jgi:hypothetical protein
MSRARVIQVAFTLSCLISPTLVAQVPPELQAAMQARDEAITKADAATWDRLTADDFTVVTLDGTLMTKAERLAQLKTQKATTRVPPQNVQVKHYGDVFVRRFRTGDAWILDIWVKGAKGWRAAAVQVTPAKK